MLKRCNKCQEEKLSSDFRKDKSKPDGLRYECKECSRIHNKSLYTARYADATNARDKKRYATAKEKVDEYKRAHPCNICGETEPVTLEFHHLDPNEKDFAVSGNYNRSWMIILTEIEKCVVLCANCHRKVHAGIIKIPI